MSFFQEALAPIISVGVSIFTPVAVTAAVRLIQKLGVDIDAKNREALQSALENAAITAVTRGAGAGGVLTNIAIDYVRNSVPGAIKKFGLDDRKLEKLVQPHIEKAKAKLNK